MGRATQRWNRLVSLAVKTLIEGEQGCQRENRTFLFAGGREDMPLLGGIGKWSETAVNWLGIGSVAYIVPVLLEAGGVLVAFRAWRFGVCGNRLPNGGHWRMNRGFPMECWGVV
ncbi:MAG: hypothetical protein M2R46_04247 [Verrucomicrobia subdivision 3 bacterium]|nr:hypothetical protein [Limisphaerales bacterium]